MMTDDRKTYWPWTRAPSFWKFQIPTYGGSGRPPLTHDWRCGHHSGFPTCCVIWFVTTWRLISYWPWANLMYHRLRWEGLGRCQYIRCPWCKLTGRIETMSICECRKEKDR